MFHLHLEEYGAGRAGRRSTATSTRRRSTSSTARATRSTTASATTGRPATSRSCTTTACTSISTPSADQAGARARDQDEADVHVHEHAVPEAGRAAADRAGARAPRVSSVARERRGLQPPHECRRTDGRHGVERIESMAERHRQPEVLPGAAGRRGDGAGAQREAQEGASSPRTCRGRCRGRGCSST